VSKDDNTVPLPAKQTKLSAGYDVHCPVDVTIGANGCAKIGLGFSVRLSPEVHLRIHSRSGLAFNYGLHCFPGIIDAGKTKADASLDLATFSHSLLQITRTRYA